MLESPHFLYNIIILFDVTSDSLQTGPMKSPLTSDLKLEGMLWMMLRASLPILGGKGMTLELPLLFMLNNYCLYALLSLSSHVSLLSQVFYEIFNYSRHATCHYLLMISAQIFVKILDHSCNLTSPLASGLKAFQFLPGPIELGGAHELP